MNNYPFLKVRIYAVVIVSVGIWGLLIWNYYHGGIPVHHLLARKDMPGMSNAWGGLLLPLLTWYAGWRIQQRENTGNGVPAKVVYAFTAALAFGILLSVLFTLGQRDSLAYLLLAVLVISLFFPVFRIECLLGLVAGMVFTFGAILPTIAGCILAVPGFLIYKLIRPGLMYAGTFLYKRN